MATGDYGPNWLGAAEQKARAGDYAWFQTTSDVNGTAKIYWSNTQDQNSWWDNGTDTGDHYTFFEPIRLWRNPERPTEQPEDTGDIPKDRLTRYRKSSHEIRFPFGAFKEHLESL